MRPVRATIAALLLCAVLGCRDKSATTSTTSSAPPPTPPESAEPAPPPRYHARDVEDGHALLVKVTYVGKSRPPATWTLPKVYEAHCNTTTVANEALVADEKGGVDGAVAWLDDITEGEAPSTSPVVQDQKGCAFTPHVLAMSTGAALRLTNEDPANHAARIDFLGTPEIDQVNKVIAADHGLVIEPPQMTRWAGRVARVTCPLHLWMYGWMLFFDHPYFAVTSHGEAKMKHVPPGTYHLVVWHEGLGTSWTGAGTDEVKTAPPVTTRVEVTIGKSDVTRAFTLAEDGTLSAAK